MGAFPLVSPDKALVKKANTLIANHRQDAKRYKVELDYDRDDLLVILRTCQQQCTYCRLVVALDDLQLDHQLPLSRGKVACRLDNLAPCCRRCNLLKSCLDMDEFQLLRQFLRSLDPRSRVDVERRLMSGGSVCARGRKSKRSC